MINLKIGMEKCKSRQGQNLKVWETTLVMFHTTDAALPCGFKRMLPERRLSSPCCLFAALDMQINTSVAAFPSHPRDHRWINGSSRIVAPADCCQQLEIHCILWVSLAGGTEYQETRGALRNDAQGMTWWERCAWKGMAAKGQVLVWVLPCLNAAALRAVLCSSACFMQAALHPRGAF